MEKIKYYQLAFKNGECRKLVSPGRTEITALAADGWELHGFDSDPGFVNPVLDNGVVREMTAAEIEAKNTELNQAAALGKTVFQKLDIRRAMRALGMEDALNTAVKKNEVFAADWQDTVEVDLSDEIVSGAILAAGFTSEDIKKIKLKIAEIGS